jgi:hypothetical protein
MREWSITPDPVGNGSPHEMPRFKVASALLTNGEVCVIGVPGEKGSKLSVDGLNLRAENITNSTDLAATLMARLSTDARVLSSGKFELQAQGYPLSKVPTFNLDLSSTDIDLGELRDIIAKAVDIDVRHGVAGLYVEAAAADGYIRGYAKPVFDHFELEPPARSGLAAHIKVLTAKVLAWFFTNKRQGSDRNAPGFRRRLRRSPPQHHRWRARIHPQRLQHRGTGVTGAGRRPSDQAAGP